jgi:hypothetical protein
VNEEEILAALGVDEPTVRDFLAKAQSFFISLSPTEQSLFQKLLRNQNFVESPEGEVTGKELQEFLCELSPDRNVAFWCRFAVEHEHVEHRERAKIIEETST